MLCEIAFHHETLIPDVFKVASWCILQAQLSEQQARDDVLQDCWDICYYLSLLNDNPTKLDFVRLLGTETPFNDDHLKRKFLIYLMRNACPPFTQEFLTEMLACLSKPIVRKLFFPERGHPLPAVFQSGLEMICRFTEQLNRDYATSTYAKDVKPYDELRREARQRLDAAKGSQYLLRSFI
jgi:hypothetical protein